MDGSILLDAFGLAFMILVSCVLHNEETTQPLENNSMIYKINHLYKNVHIACMCVCVILLFMFNFSVDLFIWGGSDSGITMIIVSLMPWDCRQQTLKTVVLQLSTFLIWPHCFLEHFFGVSDSISLIQFLDEWRQANGFVLPDQNVSSWMSLNGRTFSNLFFLFCMLSFAYKFC